MSQRGRVKRDKWREELLQAETEYTTWSNKVIALQQEQEMSRAREQLLLQMIDGLRVIADAMADYITQQQQQQHVSCCDLWQQQQQLCTAFPDLNDNSMKSSSSTMLDDLGLPHGGDDLSSVLDLAGPLDLDQQQQVLPEQQQQQQQQIFLSDGPLSDLELELLSAFIETPQHSKQQQQQHRGMAAAAAAAAAIGSSVSDDQNLLQKSRSIDQQIHQRLQCLDSSSSSTGSQAAAAAAVLDDLDHRERMELLGRLFALETLKQVLGLSAQQLANRLRELVGQCAILSFQGDSASQYWHMPAAAAPGPSSSASASGVALASAESPASSSSSGTSGGSSSSSAAVQQFTFHPAFEFISIQLGTMLFNPSKWQQLRVLEMQSHAHCDLLPAGFWQNVAEKLELSDQQVRRLSILRNLTLPKLSSVGGQLANAAAKQHALIDAQIAQLQKLSLHDKPQQQQQQQRQQQQVAHTAMRELQQQQESLISQQESNVAAMLQIGLTIGMGTMIILTYKQLALFIAASYPSSPRMDLLLSAVATLPRYQQQQQPQQQQEQCDGKQSN